MLTPVPCSALSEPSYLSTISSTSSPMNALVALAVLGLREVRREHEVEVARRGVAGDAGEEPVLAEQRLDVARRTRRSAPGGTQTSSTISAVPGGRSRPTSPYRPSRTRQYISIALRVAREVGPGGSARCPPRTSLGAASPCASSSAASSRAELDEQRRRLGRELVPVLGRARDRVSPRPSAPARPSARPRVAPAATRSGPARSRRRCRRSGPSAIVVCGRTRHACRRRPRR